MKTINKTNQQETYLLHDGNLKLADLEDLSNLQEADILIRSGQYFTTLATKLDKLSDELKKENEVQIHNLQVIINELLFIQQNYRIKKKR